ncbi:hypothetical protein HMI55_004941, partial [Coelomomyces lativittatus]
MFITLQTASFFLFFSTFFLNFIFGQRVKLVYVHVKFTFPNIHDKVQNDFPVDFPFGTKLEQVKRIKNKLTKKQRNQKRCNSKPQPSNEKQPCLTSTSKGSELSISNNVFSLATFHKERDNDMFFGSGFILKESLMSTSFPHYHMYSANQQRYAQQDVVVSLIQENEAEKQQKMMDCIQDIFGENSSYWLPVFEIDTLYNDVLFKCSPYYCSVGKYLEEKKSFNLVEAQHLTVFVLMISLKLEEMHLGYPEKFSF